MILAAITDSDGTRKGVLDQVFTGDGVTVPADEAMLGKDVGLSTDTGECTLRDVTLSQIVDQRESKLATVGL